MKISYRYLPLDAALKDLDEVKSGIFNIHEKMGLEDFHLRPFTDLGIHTDRLLEIRANIFKEFGTPSQNISDLAIKESDFDRIFTRICLTTFHDLNPIDAFNRDVWSYLTLRVLPDLALWRWRKNKTDERFLGGAERSCFQRLWLRSYVLGGDLASQLFEDEAVNIFERPEAIGGNRRLTHAFANFVVSNRGLVDAETGSKKINTEIVKQAAKRLRRSMSVQLIQSMSDNEITLHIEKIFDDALKARVNI